MLSLMNQSDEDSEQNMKEVKTTMEMTLVMKTNVMMTVDRKKTDAKNTRSR
jgi:hypothetical protein